MMISWVFPGTIIVFVIGMILMAVAVDWISELIGEREISANMTAAILTVVVGILVGTGVTYYNAYSNSLSVGSLSTGSPSFVDAFYSSLSTFVPGLVVIWLFFLLTAYFLRKVYDALSDSLGVGLFSITGLLFFAGAVMIIVFGLGFAVIFIAATIQLAAFLAMPDDVPPRSRQAKFGHQRLAYSNAELPALNGASGFQGICMIFLRRTHRPSRLLGPGVQCRQLSLKSVQA